VAFPYWEDHYGWTAAGVRSDTLSGRRVTTVYYTGAAKGRVAYSIVAGAALAAPAGRVLILQGVRLEVVQRGGTTIVTWLRSGHSCVLSARGVPLRVLEQLASWRARGTIPY
jgi:hypothetical protein